MRRARKARISSLAGIATCRASRYGSSASRTGFGSPGVSARAAANDALSASAASTPAAPPAILRPPRHSDQRTESFIIGVASTVRGRTLLRGCSDRQRSVHAHALVVIADEVVRSVDEARIDDHVVVLCVADDVRSGLRIAELGSFRRLVEMDVVRSGA